MGGSIVNQTRRQLQSSNLNWNLHSRTAYCIKVEDKVAGLVGQKYTIGQELLERQWRVYLLRHKYPDYLVTIYDILPEQSNSICTTNKLFSVVIEHIPYRLSDLGAIKYEEAIYILSSILKGYKILKDNNIDFYLFDQNNVCFNKKGKCKIWIHQNLYLVKPQPNRSISQRRFIQVVYYMMQERVSEKRTFFQQNLIAVNNLSLQYLLAEIQKSTPCRLVCMESLRNMNSQTSRQNDISSQAMKSKIISPEKRSSQITPSFSQKKNKYYQPHYQYSVTASKKLSLAAKKKQLNNSDQKSFKNPKSSVMPNSSQQLHQGKTNTYYSQIFVGGDHSKRIDGCNHSQIFNKPKSSNIREGGSGELTKSKKHNFTKLKFIYNNSTKKL